MVWPALIAAGASLAGGILANRAIRRENEINRARQDNQLQRMMEDAGAAGIHPIAAMGMSADYGSPVGSPETAFGEGLAGAGRAASDVMLAQQDFQVSAQELELERMRLDNEMRYFALQEAQSRSIMSAVRSQVLQAPAAIVEDPSPALMGGMPFEIGAAGPYTPSRVAEDVYGEPGEWLFGGWNLLRDLGANFREAVYARFPALEDLTWSTPIIRIGNPDRRDTSRWPNSIRPGVNMETDRLWRLRYPQYR